ncbi:DUF6608 family protein [Candidatus Contubernalis alkaliaceticus]|uniref:DUF6608 family protein n=1 Tax=Candidatus Contubernalis alkaliaceticus TaxID=338645 RepID=UPI001F4C4865|nr:DUF6608 family protein [Candidatus Contubernalis alkalaceticus]UNC92100.1 hypothetical protein HUE98_08315 [Candidatus Contubernalis alkalaceticus]
MTNLILVEIKKGIILFSILYTFTTITSSAWQLYTGQLTDTNVHLLNRAAVIFIAVATIHLFFKVQVKNQVLRYLLPYAISMGLVLGYTWLFGRFQPLHPDAYRDIFLNFTVIAAIVIAVMIIIEKVKLRRK